MLIDEIDILITMSNHSISLELLALRPSALQGSWLQASTRSLQLYLDFVIADRNLISFDERDDWSEYILEPPLCPAKWLILYQAFKKKPMTDPSSSVCFSKRSKITHRMINLVQDYQVPGSKIKLRTLHSVISCKPCCHENLIVE